MKKDILYLVTKRGDKNNAIELRSDNKNKIEELNEIFNNICYLRKFISSFDNVTYEKLKEYKPYVDLELFRQSYNVENKNKDFFIMLETWTSKEDLMLEFGEFCAKKLSLTFDII